MYYDKIVIVETLATIYDNLDDFKNNVSYLDINRIWYNSNKL